MKLQWEHTTFSQDGDPVLVEIMPTDGHERGTDCPFCEPRPMMLCPECEDQPTTPTDCWKCGGRGLVEYDPSSGAVPWFVHQDPRLE